MGLLIPLRNSLEHIDQVREALLLLADTPALDRARGHLAAVEGYILSQIEEREWVLATRTAWPVADHRLNALSSENRKE